MAVVRKSIPATAAASTKVTLPDVQAAFAKHWGGREYRPFQNQVVGSLLSGVDTLGVFAVGMGKSAVFQAPAAVLPGTTLVISPLIALMKDQVDGSRARGVAADCINSNMDEREIEAAMKRCASGEVKLLYVAPERLVSPAFNRMLRALHVPLVACDEAHCHPADGLVDTPAGPRRADRIVAGDYVLGLDALGSVVPRQVEVVMSREVPLGTMVRICVDGCTNALIVTEDHPVFVESRGWVEAQHVCPGDTVVVRTDRRSFETSAVPGDMSGLRGAVHGILAGEARPLHAGVLAALRRNDAEPSVWNHVAPVLGMRGRLQAVQAGSESEVLHTRVPTAAHGSPAPQDVPPLWRTIRSALRQVLQPEVCVPIGGLAPSASAVPCMRNSVREDFTQADLLPAVRGGVARSCVSGAHAAPESDEGFGGARSDVHHATRDEVEACGDGGKGARIDGATAYSVVMAPADGGGVSVRRGGEDRQPGSSTLHAGSGGSRAAYQCGSGRGQSLQQSSAAQGQVEGCTPSQGWLGRVSRVERGCFQASGANQGTTATVYSFSVAGEHRYFASGILTHNCCSRFSSFRPAYLRIRQCINQLATRPVIVALTATMTAHIEPEVIKALGMRENYARFVGDPVRSNLEYRNVWATDTRRGGEWGELDKVLPRLASGEGRHIVYTTSRKGAEIIAGKLTEKTGMDGGQIGYYHAGMQRDDRRRLQDEFVGGRKRVIVATVAFGMGIDIPDIRTVVNFGIPGSMEDVVQMGGRAGRDGNRSLCLCIGSDYSEGLQTRFINGEHPEWQTYEEVHAWLRANLEPNDTLYLSAEAIVKRMGESGGKRGTYDASAVGSVLHKFEAYGVVTRRPMSSASDITLLPAAADADLTGNAARVRDALVAIIGRPIPGQTRTGMVEGPAVAERSGVPAYLVNAALLRMVDQNLIRKMPSYNGKSTTWNPGEHLKPLAEIISREEVEERRRLELERLQHVVDYVRAPSPAQYIRDYFAKPT